MVVELNLNNSNFGDTSCAALEEAVEVKTKIDEMLREQHRRYRGCAVFAEALKENTAMTLLDLSGNIIGDEGCAALAEAMKETITLETAHLSENNIGDAGYAVLAEVFSWSGASQREQHRRCRICKIDRKP